MILKFKLKTSTNKDRHTYTIPFLRIYNRLLQNSLFNLFQQLNLYIIQTCVKIDRLFEENFSQIGVTLKKLYLLNSQSLTKTNF